MYIILRVVDADQLLDDNYSLEDIVVCDGLERIQFFKNRIDAETHFVLNNIEGQIVKFPGQYSAEAIEQLTRLNQISNNYEF